MVGFISLDGDPKKEVDQKRDRNANQQKESKSKMARQDDFRIVMGFTSVLSDFLGLLARSKNLWSNDCWCLVKTRFKEIDFR